MLIKPDGSPLKPAAAYEIAPSTPPFQYHIGEQVGGLGSDFVIAPLHKWADTPIVQTALDSATRAFSKKATNTNVKIVADERHILIQEYHRQDRIAIIVAAWGRQMGMQSWGWLYAPTVIRLTPKLKAHLVLTGRWKAATRH